MVLINPIFGLPFSAVDRVSENEEKKRKGDKKRNKEEDSGDKNRPLSDEERLDPSDATELSSQILDTQTIVKLIEAHLECRKSQEHSLSSASNLYNHVKNIAQTSIFNRAV